MGLSPYYQYFIAMNPAIAQTMPNMKNEEQDSTYKSNIL